MTLSPSPQQDRQQRPSKYRAQAVEIDGIRFASKAEGRRYADLKLLERGKEIWGLKLQVPYQLIVNGIKVGVYIADFVYTDRHGEHVEDVKGFATPIFRLKAKMFEAQYDREIEIIGGRT